MTLTALGTALGDLARATRRLAVTAKPSAPGSLADQERHAQASLTDTWSDKPVDVAYSVAGLAQHVAEDLLLGVERLVHAHPVHRFAVEAMVRCALEACAQAWWLLDPKIDMRQRVARGMAERIHGLQDRRGLEHRLGGSTVETDRLLDQIRASAARKQLRLARRPAADQLVEDLLGGDGLGRAVYQFTSQVVHGNYAGVLDRATTVPNLARPGEQLAVTTTLGLPMVLAVARLGFVAVVDRQVQVHGWPDSEWVAAKQQAEAVFRDR
jgi:hypothetical protein